MVRFGILAAALMGALLLGAAAYLLAPPGIALTAGVAVYAASLATAGFLVNGRQAVIDRSDLRAEVTLLQLGDSAENLTIQVRFFNAGRRPVKIEEAGWWVDKSRTAPYPYWQGWGKDRTTLPKSLPEGDSHTIWTWPGGVAQFYVRHDPVAYLWAKPAHGPIRWWGLPGDVRREIADAWPAAQEAYRQKMEAEAAEHAVEDGHGHPVQPPDKRNEG